MTFDCFDESLPMDFTFSSCSSRHSLRQTEVIIKEMTSANFLLMKLVNSITVETLRYSSHITIG